MTTGFDPDWVVAPGDLLAEWFEEHGEHSFVPRSYRARRFGIRDSQLQAVLDGQPLSDDLAIRLGGMTGITSRFWMAMEHNFRIGLAAGKTWLTPAERQLPEVWEPMPQ